MAHIECDRCPRTTDLSTDQYDSLVSEFPEAEVERGVLVIRCTAWPVAA